MGGYHRHRWRPGWPVSGLDSTRLLKRGSAFVSILLANAPCPPAGTGLEHFFDRSVGLVWLVKRDAFTELTVELGIIVWVELEAIGGNRYATCRNNFYNGA